MATAIRSKGYINKQNGPAVPSIRVTRQHDDSDSNAISKVKLNYPVLFLGTVAVAGLIFWHREKTKNVYTGEPILTVRPSTDADVSTVQNIQHLVDFDQNIFDVRSAKQLN